MTYLHKGHVFTLSGKSLIPADARPSPACWEAYHEFLVMSKKEQEKCRK
jgi:hypothetical protein